MNPAMFVVLGKGRRNEVPFWTTISSRSKISVFWWVFKGLHWNILEPLTDNISVELKLIRISLLLTQQLSDIITYWNLTKQSCNASLTGGLVVGVAVALGAIDAQEGLVVVVLVPVEGQHPGAPSLWVPTEEAGHAGQQLSERLGSPGLKQRGEHPQKLLGAVPLHQLDM